MANRQLGNQYGVVAASGHGQNGGSDYQTGLANSPHLATLAAKKARLAALDGTTYTAARLQEMSVNDINFAIRTLDNPSSIK